MEHIPGPDFPTGGSILGRAGIRSAYATGRGSIIMRAKVEVEELRKDREALIVTEIPYQVNKATLIERIAELVREKRVEGISDLRDESDRDGMRIVIELRRDAVADVVLNQLWRFTALQSSFGANMIALNGGRPEMLTLKDMLRAFLDFREEVVTRRTKYLLTKARDNAHLQVGLAIAVANIDEVIRLIRTSPDTGAARVALMERAWPARDMAPLITLIADPRHALDADGAIRLSDAQARAILELRLARLTALGRDEIAEALNRLAARNRRLSRHPQLARPAHGHHPRRARQGEDRLRHAAPHDDPRQRSRHGGRGPHPARGHGRAGQPRRLHQARAAIDLSRAAARRQGPRRHGDARRGFRRPAVRRLDPSAGAVLLLGRPGLQGEGLAPAACGAAVARQGAGQPAAARAGRAHHHHHAAAGGRGELGDARRDVRHHRAARSGATSSPTSPRSTAPARSPCGSTRASASSTSQICSDKDDVLLTTARGQCIRFAVDDVRVFKGRDSMGVRGIALAEGDSVISLAILHAVRRHGGRARRLSQAAPRHGAARPADESGDADGEAEDGAERTAPRSRRSVRGDVGRRAGHPDDLRERLRQAHLVVRVPRHRARRQRHRRDGGQRPQRQAGRLVPGRGRATRSCW